MMKKNMSQLDRILRVAIAVLIPVLYFTNIISGTWAIILGIVALVLLVTGLVGTCPLYTLLNFSTQKDS